jgi:hypothetical protein
MIRTILTSAAIAAVLSAPAFGWGQTGHRVTGAIAEQHLTAEAEAAVHEILGVETLAEASTWPDFMRSSRDPFWRAAGPFHYVTVPEGETYAHHHAPEQGDSVTALAMFTETLRDPAASLEDKQRALRFIVHIIGDLHQPLHAGNGTDRGGNDVRVDWFGDRTNLHSVWDTRLVEHENLSYSEMTEWLSARITPELVAEWSVTDPVVWISESTEVRDTIYPEPDEDGDINLGWRYAYEHTATMRQRLSMGGVRIAAYLNAVFAAD